MEELQPVSSSSAYDEPGRALHARDAPEPDPSPISSGAYSDDNNDGDRMMADYEDDDEMKDVEFSLPPLSSSSIPVAVETTGLVEQTLGVRRSQRQVNSNAVIVLDLSLFMSGIA